MGDAIRRKIRDARDEMVEALYPIIGRTVIRAVSEAIRDLARAVDAQMRASLSPQTLWRRLKARIKGVPSAEVALREALPFQVNEVFLIHRETGLLLRHISCDPEASPDSDLISGMLTAIRDFAQDAFGRGQEGELNAIQYGERRIMIEAARHAYLAVVVDGIEPPGFRAEMRERIIDIEHAYEKTLRNYDGDPMPLAPAEASLRSLLTAGQPRALSPAQKCVMTGMLSLVVICLAMFCLSGRWVWQVMHRIPTPLPVAVEPTFTAIPPSTPTATLSPTPTVPPSPTPTLTPTPAATASATPTPVIGLMLGNVWIRTEPAAASPRLGLILEQGQSVEILAVFGDWCQVRWAPQAQVEVVGWVPVKWVGTIDPIPAQIITPMPGS